MKKVIFVACLLGVFSLTACSKKNKDSVTEADKITSTTTTIEQSATQDEEQSNSKESENVVELEVKIIEDENFDFNANFETALKVSAGKDAGNTDNTAKKEDKEVNLPPDPVSNLQCTFNWKENLVDLTWDEPSDPDLSHVEIRTNNSKKVVILPKGKRKYSFPAKGKQEQQFIVTTCDSIDQKGRNVGCAISDTYLFKSISIPVVANTGFGKTISAQVTGINFDQYGIKESDFYVNCTTRPSVTGKSKVHRVDSNNLIATMTIPKSAGEYNIAVSCGDLKISGTLTVEDYLGNYVGKIIYCGSTPESVIAGYDSNGYPFGIGLKEQASLKWALESSYGYDNCFDEIVCQPSVVGIDSAIKATFSGDLNGEDNWEAICEKDKDCKNEDGSINDDYARRNYPIFHYAMHYGETAKLPKKAQDGWFIPSISELCQIYANREVINNSLAEVRGKRLRDEFYWSSTQNDYSTYNACAVKFVNGAIYKYYNKGNAVLVRCIKMYKKN